MGPSIRHSVAALVFLLAGFLAWAAGGHPPAVAPSDDAKEFIVTWRSRTALDAREGVVRAVGGVVRHHFEFGPDSVVWLPNKAAESLLRRDFRVASVVPNRRIDVDGPPKCLDCGGGPPPSQQVIPTGVSRVGASPGFVPFTGQGVGVAVVDTGIWAQHRDLIRADGTRVVASFCFKDPSILSCDGDVSDLPGGHGTKVAGLIAAVNNNVDVVGVAPQATLYNVNVFRWNPTDCYPGTTCSDDGRLIQGLEWILARPSLIKVVNISLGRAGSVGDNPTLRNRVQQLAALGILVVTSAGNDPAAEVSGRVPASYPELMAVAATTARLGSDDGSICSVFPHVPADTASWYTTDGAFNAATKVGVTISAPGEDRADIVAGPGRCMPQSVGFQVLSNVGGVTRDAAYGTSFAAPLVTGVVALMKEQAAQLGLPLDLNTARDRIRSHANLRLDVPLDPTLTPYTFDGEREGIAWAPGALQ
jgi:subtilisin family serine protease